MPTRFLLWISLAVLGLATLASAAGAVTSVPDDPGAMPDCHYGAGHNLCFDGSSAKTAALKCSRQAAKNAISSSSFANAVQRESDRLELKGSLFDVWRIDDLHCRDVTRDGRADIVVLLGVRGGSSGAPPVPWAIFRATASGYVLAFQRSRFVGHRVRVTAGGDVIYTVPIYKRSDPLCCPSSYKRYRVHWRNAHFVVRRVHKRAARRS